MSKPAISNSLARLLAPDDIQPGMHVCVHTVLLQYLACSESSYEAPRVHLLDVMPWRPPEVLLIAGVALPFVLVTDSKRAHRLIDTRQERLCAVPSEFGQAARRGHRADIQRARALERRKKA